MVTTRVMKDREGRWEDKDNELGLWNAELELWGNSVIVTK
jgi:hypothetical protein